LAKLEFKMSEEYIEMGSCTKAHGLKGDFIFNLHNTIDSSVKVGVKLLLKPFTDTSSVDPKGETFEVENIRFGNKVIARLMGVDSRNQVDAMMPFTIFISRVDFKEIADGEVYLSDLVGIGVFDSEDARVGVVLNFYDNGAQPVLVIELLDGNKIELPFVEAFFPDVNMDEEKITMINPGLY